MSTISIEEVRRVAALAKIAITDKEAKAFSEDMAVILEYVKKLDAVDTSGLLPTYQVTGLTNVTRPDVMIDYGVDQAGLFQNVANHKDGQIKVPRVL